LDAKGPASGSHQGGKRAKKEIPTLRNSTQMNIILSKRPKKRVHDGKTHHRKKAVMKKRRN